MEHTSSVVSIEAPLDQSGNRPLSLIQYRCALEMCAGKEIDVIFTGHGEPILNHRELIQKRLRKNWLSMDRILNFLKDGEKTTYELMTLLYPNLYQKMMSLTLSQTVGYLDLLQLLNQVAVKKIGGVVYYSS
jgi:hypothetical protein